MWFSLQLDLDCLATMHLSYEDWKDIFLNNNSKQEVKEQIESFIEDLNDNVDDDYENSIVIFTVTPTY